jgi:plasmid stabilization system protein ParE
MATVVVTKTAQADLDRLIHTHGLPASTWDRVKASLGPLATFPLLGRALTGRWAGFRVVLGPWPWMLVVHTFDAAADRVIIVTIQDARSAQSATSQR